MLSRPDPILAPLPDTAHEPTPHPARRATGLVGSPHHRALLDIPLQVSGVDILPPRFQLPYEAALHTRLAAATSRQPAIDRTCYPLPVCVDLINSAPLLRGQVSHLCQALFGLCLRFLQSRDCCSLSPISLQVFLVDACQLSHLYLCPPSVFNCAHNVGNSTRADHRRNSDG